MSDAETAIDAVTAAENEIEAALLKLSAEKTGRIQRADHEIPIKYAEIRLLEDHIETYRKDREWCTEQVRLIDRRLHDLRGTR